jgi:hypothetical protein
MSAAERRLCLVTLAVDGAPAGSVHQSILDRVAEIARRLDLPTAARVDGLPVAFDSAMLPCLKRELREVAAFSDAARRTGWVLGDLAAAPGDQPVPVLDTPEGRLWATSARGFAFLELGGAHPVNGLARAPGTPRRIPLLFLMAPLAEAAAQAELLELRREGQGAAP